MQIVESLVMAAAPLTSPLDLVKWLLWWRFFIQLLIQCYELFVMFSFMFAIIMYVFIASNLLQGRNNSCINEYKTTALFTRTENC